MSGSCSCPLCASAGSLSAGPLSAGSGAAAAPAISFDTRQAAAQITRNGYHWGDVPASGVSLTYGFRTSGPTYSGGGDDLSGSFVAFQPAQIAAAVSALQLWADVANISFVRDLSAGGGYGNDASLLFGGFRIGPSYAFAYLPNPGGTAPAAAEGDVWTNVTYDYGASDIVTDAGLTAGRYGFMAMMHEIGHALGLEHPGDYNAGSGGAITYGESALYREDTRQFTIMSYFDASNSGADHVGSAGTVYAWTPLLHDIAAIQGLYGPNRAARTGDTVYGFNSNADRSAYRLTSAAAQPVFAIWDAGGTDTLDASGYSVDQTIDLRENGFSSIGGLTQNVAIAAGAVVEWARGGSGADTMIGNAAANALDGGPGDDFLFGGASWDYLDGGAGRDRAAVSGTPGQYYGWEADGLLWISDRMAGRDDGIALRSVEEVTFQSPLYNVPWANEATTFTLQTAGREAQAPFCYALLPWVTLGAGEQRPAADLFEAADPAANAVWGYLINDPAPGGAYFSIDGARVASGTWQWVSILDWDRVAVGAEAGAGESLQVLGNAGGVWTNGTWLWTQANQQQPPWATPLEHVELAGGGTIDVDNLFFAYGNGTAITTYAVLDPTGAGSLQLDGLTLASGTWQYFSPAQFDRLAYRIGSAPEELQFRAYSAGGASDIVGRNVGRIDWAASTETEAVVLPGWSAYGRLDAVGDRDWIRVDLPAGQWEIRLQGADSLAGSLPDPYLRLRDEAGKEVMADDDGGTGRDAALTLTTARTTTFFIGAASYLDGYSGSYRATVLPAATGASTAADVWAVAATQELEGVTTPLAGSSELLPWDGRKDAKLLGLAGT